jgi:transcriptional regulator with XRE-family HTH domain
VTRRRQGEIGPVIARLRRERGLTQAELAARLDVHRNTVGGWERGTAAAPLSALGSLCRALGVRPEVFVDLPVRDVRRYFTD